MSLQQSLGSSVCVASSCTAAFLALFISSNRQSNCIREVFPSCYQIHTHQRGFSSLCFLSISKFVLCEVVWRESFRIVADTSQARFEVITAPLTVTSLR